MTASTAPKLSKWPFFLGDALLLGLAWLIHSQSSTPTGALEIISYILCVAIGAWISLIPFLKEYQAAIKLAEADQLVSVTSQIENLDQLAAQIGYATSQWQTIRESADKTANTARSIAERMAAEVKAFNEFIQKTNEGEKATLRLEIEKLRRGEVEWLQVLVRILDHVFAVYQAARRSKQPGVADELEKFQAACVDSARRIGLIPFIPARGEPYDAQRHQLIDGSNAEPAEGALVEETLATGYTFQSRQVRPALVRLQEPAGEESASTESDSASVSDDSASSDTASDPQSQLL